MSMLSLGKDSEEKNVAGGREKLEPANYISQPYPRGMHGIQLMPLIFCSQIFLKLNIKVRNYEFRSKNFF